MHSCAIIPIGTNVGNSAITRTMRTLHHNSMTVDHLETSTNRDLEDQYNVFQCILVAQGHYSILSYQLSVSRVGCTDRSVM